MNPICTRCFKGEDKHDTYICIGCYRKMIGVAPNQSISGKGKKRPDLKGKSPSKGRGKIKAKGV